MAGSPLPRVSGGRLTAAVALLLALATAAVFRPSLGNGFIDFDDDWYITANRHVTGGLTRENIGWAFTSLGYASNWHPLTWLSHQADVQLFGLSPAGHHLTSLLLHAAGAALLFLALRGMTGAAGPSACAAALWALHPLRVESVAWAAERKDVLAGLFLMLTLLAYLRYLRRPATGRYLALLGSLVLGLLAKPTLMSLPAALLLLDYWPLGRWTPPATGRRPVPPARLLIEKLPLLLPAVASAAVTVLAQARGGGLRDAVLYPIRLRFANASLSAVRYLAKTAWPADLAILYPFLAHGLPAWQVAAATAVLAGITATVLLLRRAHPCLGAGWLWYLVTLLPMAGLVQVGYQAMADRYTYLPSIGLALMLCWGIPAILPPFPRRKAILGALAAAALLALAWRTGMELAYWRTSGALFTRALAVTENNWLMHNNLGAWLDRQQRDEEAAGQFREALRLNPVYSTAHYNLGTHLLRNKRLAEAEAELRRALELRPDFPDAHFNLGISLFWQGRAREAIAQYRQTLRQRPDHEAARKELDWVLSLPDFPR